MKLVPINSFRYNAPAFSFKGNIIDSHVHTGQWQSANYGADTLDAFVREPLKVNIGTTSQTDTVEKMLVSNLSCIDKNGGILNETQGNIEMLNICKKNPKLYPLAVCQPKKTSGNASAIRQLLDENDGQFVGLKFHPKVLTLRADDSRYDDYLKLAEEKKLPCLFHSQVNAEWKPDSTGTYIPNLAKDVAKWDDSDPEFIYTLAKRHPKVPVILGHTGAGAGAAGHKKTIDILVKSIENNDAKLYCDISWVDFENNLPVENSKSLIDLIQRLKEKNVLDRILFGTDSALGCYGGDLAKDSAGNSIPAKAAYERTVSTIKTTIKQNFGDEADDIIQKIFHDNADELFFKKKWARDLSENLGSSARSPETTGFFRNMSKTQAGLLFAGVILAFTGIGIYCASKLKKGNNNEAPITQNNNPTVTQPQVYPVQTAPLYSFNQTQNFNPALNYPNMNTFLAKTQG